MEDLLRLFIEHIANGEFNVIREATVKQQLSLFLRERLDPWTPEVELSVKDFDFEPATFAKKFIDVSVLDSHGTPIAAIELKFPRGGSGATPLTMFEFCRDICFLEQLKAAGFHRAYLLILTDDHLFYNPEKACGKIYDFFRAGCVLQGTVKKPTGQPEPPIEIAGAYIVEWLPVKDELWYALIEAQ